MPYKRREDGKVDSGLDGHPVLDEVELDDQDSTNSGAPKYWKHFLIFDQGIRDASISTDHCETSRQDGMKKDRKERRDFSWRRQGWYVEDGSKVPVN